MEDEYSAYGTASWEFLLEEDNEVSPDIEESSVDGLVLDDGRVYLPPYFFESEADHKLSHRWLLDDVNGPVEDSVGNADGTNNGVTPELSSIHFQVEATSTEDEGSIGIIEWLTATTSSDSDGGFFSFSWLPFGSSSDDSSDEDDTNTIDTNTTDSDTDDGGWFDFSFDFWPFNGSDSESDS